MVNSVTGALGPVKLAMGIVTPVTVFAYQSLGTRDRHEKERVAEK
jgi:hypothetical protein